MGYIHSDLEKAHFALSNLIGEEIIITEPVSKRGKKVGKVGILSNTFNNYFRVTFENNSSTNYNYADIFTKVIKIQFFDGNDFVPLKVPRALTKKETVPSLFNEQPELFNNNLNEDDENYDYELHNLYKEIVFGNQNNPDDYSADNYFSENIIKK